MGTRADMYVGRGEKAEWLGSVAWDGHPENFLHLFEGTAAQNMRDAAVKGRMMRGEHHVFAKLSDQQVVELRRRRAKGELLKDLALHFGVAESAVSRIANGIRRAP